MKTPVNSARAYLDWMYDFITVLDEALEESERQLRHGYGSETVYIVCLFDLLELMDRAPLNYAYHRNIHPGVSLLGDITMWARRTKVPYGILEQIITMLDDHDANVSEFTREGIKEAKKTQKMWAKSKSQPGK